MHKEHRKNHNIALVGTAVVTLVIILLWVRVLLPLEKERNKVTSVPTSDLIESMTPDTNSLPKQPTASDLLAPQTPTYQQ